MRGARHGVYITAIQQNIDTTTPSTHRTHTTVADGDTRGAQPCEHPRTTHAPTQQTETQVNRKYICAAAPTAVERARSTPLFVPRVAFSAAASRCVGDGVGPTTTDGSPHRARGVPTTSTRTRRGLRSGRPTAILADEKPAHTQGRISP